MRTEFDLSPLFRSTVGFDRMLEALRSAARVDQLESYPPYDIERTGEDHYRVTLTVAGFRPEELTVTAHQNMLIVSGEKRDRAGDGNGNGSGGHRQVLHRGIATRAFERRFELADHVKVESAGLADGLLTVELRRELPEAMRPRRIEIAAAGDGKAASPRQIEGEAVENRQAA